VPKQEELAFLNAISAFRKAQTSKILEVYLSPTRPLINSDLTACLSGGIPVLKAGDLETKHVGWNSLLTTVRGKLLRDYADIHSCFIHGPDSPTTVPYNPSATHSSGITFLYRSIPGFDQPFLTSLTAPMPGEWHSVQSGISRRGNYRHVCREYSSSSTARGANHMGWNSPLSGSDSW
jgi:hypothetical protein